MSPRGSSEEDHTKTPHKKGFDPSRKLCDSRHRRRLRHLPPPRRAEDLLFTTDLLLEDIHFRRATHRPKTWVTKLWPAD